jgi:hypothetical protein
MGLEMVSITMAYFWPNLGIILRKCFQGLPLGSFKKNLTLSMIFLLFAEFFKKTLTGV